MSFSFRKSFRSGPIRINLSKSGMGVSVGVKGFRIGTGPRGDYVNIGGRRSYSRGSSAPQSDLSGGGCVLLVLFGMIGMGLLVLLIAFLTSSVSSFDAPVEPLVSTSANTTLSPSKTHPIQMRSAAESKTVVKDILSNQSNVSLESPLKLMPIRPEQDLCFSKDTPLPAILVLNETLVLKSKEYGIVGLGKRQRIKVIECLEDKVTVISGGRTFTANTRDLATATVVVSQETEDR